MMVRGSISQAIVQVEVETFNVRNAFGKLAGREMMRINAALT
jgi:hypothetical protein